MLLYVTAADPPLTSELRHAASLVKQGHPVNPNLIFLPLGIDYKSVCGSISTLGRYCLLNVAVHQVFSRNVPFCVADVDGATLTTAEAALQVLDHITLSGHDNVIEIVYSPQLLAQLAKQGLSWSLTQSCTAFASDLFSKSASGQCMFRSKVSVEDTISHPEFPLATSLQQLGASCEDLAITSHLMHITGHIPSHVLSAARRYGLYGITEEPEFGWGGHKKPILEKSAPLGRPYLDHVAIIGGSFDPLTVGHLQLAGDVLVLGRNATPPVTSAWFVPCGFRSDKPLVLSAFQRYVMCVIGVEDQYCDVPNIKAMPFEAFESGALASYELLSRLSAWRPSTLFSLVVGADLIPTLPRWKHAEDLLASCSFLAVPRPGYTTTAVSYPLPRSITFLRTEGGISRAIDISSTDIRKRISSETDPKSVFSDLETLLAPSVLNYIVATKSYRMVMSAATSKAP